MSAHTPHVKPPIRKRRGSFLTSTVVSGFVVLLPAMVMGWLLYFLYGFISPIVDPLAKLISPWVEPAARLITTQFQLERIVSFLTVIASMLVLMFIIGLIVRTAIGRVIGHLLETRFLSIAPGYNIIKEVVKQFSGDRPNPFSKACLVEIFDSKTMVTAFVIDSHDCGISTIFVPTGPNPTSGFVLHVPTARVYAIPTPVPEVMKSIIACGIGSAPLIADFKKVLADSHAQAPQTRG
jgi:uncharacterized membrane protein